MGEITDRFFLCPRQLLSAEQVDVFDAINLVLYAKFPLVNLLRGRDLVAGFVRREALDGQALLTKNQANRLLDNYEAELSSLRFPVSPSQYERLLEGRLEKGDDALPYFYHEHHLLVDRRRRAAAFARLYSELAEQVRKEAVILQRTDSERIRMLVPDAWMAHGTLTAYLEASGVAPWWKIETNLASHLRLERILLSDSLGLPSSEIPESYEPDQIPSFVFAQTLLKRSQRPRGFAPTAPRNIDACEIESKAEQQRPAGAHTTPKTQKTVALSDDLGKSPLEDPQSPRSRRGQLRPLHQGTENLLSNEETPISTNGNSEHVQDNPDALPVMHQGMLKKREVAELLGVHPNSVDNYRRRPGFPKPIELGLNTIRWERSAILEWLELQKTSTR